MVEPAPPSAIDAQTRAAPGWPGPTTWFGPRLRRLRADMTLVSAEGALLRRIAALTATCLLATLLISFEFWLPDRLYPLTPLFGLTLGSVESKAILVALVAALVVPVLRAGTPMPLFLLPCALLLLLIAADQSRMQPYIFMYLIALAVCGATMRGGDNDALLDALRLLCAGAYFWSGLQKLNVEFVNSVFPWFMSPLAKVLPGVVYGALSESAFLVPVFEALIGVLLILSPRKTLPLGMAAAMLVVVLFCLGPLGHNWNIIVWPWNVWLFTLSVWLFRGQHVPPSRLFGLGRRSAHLVKAMVFLLIGLLPSLSLAHYWDGYMSFKLYSGNTYRGAVQLDGDDKARLPAALRALAIGDELSLSAATFGLYDVASYPERRVFLSVWRQWCERYGLEGSRLVITSQSRPFGERDRTETVTCPLPP